MLQQVHEVIEQGGFGVQTFDDQFAEAVCCYLIRDMHL
jgi:hypothetical protein